MAAPQGPPHRPAADRQVQRRPEARIGGAVRWAARAARHPAAADRAGPDRPSHPGAAGRGQRARPRHLPAPGAAFPAHLAGPALVRALVACAVLVLFARPIWLPVRHPEARTALRTGRMDRRYAEVEYAGWAREVHQPAGRDPTRVTE